MGQATDSCTKKEPSNWGENDGSKGDLYSKAQPRLSDWGRATSTIMSVDSFNSDFKLLQGTLARATRGGRDIDTRPFGKFGCATRKPDWCTHWPGSQARSSTFRTTAQISATSTPTAAQHASTQLHTDGRKMCDLVRGGLDEGWKGLQLFGDIRPRYTNQNSNLY